ncbi:MAG: DUF4286 family protein [Chloroflexi bacterium]|nr:DUF4286 family protein [Chloroflexota bacterium]
MFAYTVHASFEGSDPGLIDAWIAWLAEGHLAEVLAAGALEASVLRLDDAAGTPPRCEARYRFPSRAAFEAYLRDSAPRLRAEGLARFPPESGIRYARSQGEIRVELPGGPA